MSPHPAVRLGAGPLFGLLWLAATTLGPVTTVHADPVQFLAFVGTYTDESSKGIYVFRWNAETGSATEPELAATTESPSFLALHPNGKFLYAVNETSSFRGEPSGSVSAFSIERASGKLTLLNQESSRGGSPCHLLVDGAGRNVFVASYGGGTFAGLRAREDGSLEPARWLFPPRPDAGSPVLSAPKAHCVTLDPGQKFLLGTSLGVDRIWVFRHDPVGGKPELSAVHGEVKAGAGPRHLAFRPDGKFAYVINETECSVTTFAYNEIRGELKEIQTISSLPVPRVAGWSTAEIEVHPSGKFLYGSNRGHDSILVCGIDSATGRLNVVEHEPTQGKTPRSFAIDPTGRFLLAANQGSASLVVFRIDPASGSLTPTGAKVAVPNPVCLKFLPLP